MLRPQLWVLMGLGGLPFPPSSSCLPSYKQLVGILFFSLHLTTFRGRGINGCLYKRMGQCPLVAEWGGVGHLTTSPPKKTTAKKCHFLPPHTHLILFFPCTNQTSDLLIWCSLCDSSILSTVFIVFLCLCILLLVLIAGGLFLMILKWRKSWILYSSSL